MGIFGHKPGITPPTPMWAIAVIVCDENGRPVGGAKVRMDADKFVAMTNASGVVQFPGFTSRDTTIIIERDGYDFYGMDAHLSGTSQNVCVGTPGSATDLVLPPLKSSALFLPESGALHASGKFILDDQNRIWRCRGVSGFLNPLRFMLGWPVGSDFEWMRKRGRNEIRTFWNANYGDYLADGEIQGGFTKAQFLLWKRPAESIVDFSAKAHAYFSLAASHGVRVKATVHTYDYERPAMRAYLQQMYDIAQAHWNVRIQVANEAENNRIDVVDVCSGVDRHGVMSDYGNDPERHCDAAPDQAAWTACQLREVPHLDTMASHDLRRDLHSSRIPKDCHDFQDVFNVSDEWEEPVGAVELNDPVMNPPDGDGFMGHKTGGGTRTINKDVLWSAHCVAAFYSPGMTYHPEVGAREGRMPGPGEPLQDEIAAMMGRIDQFLPGDASTGQYTRPNLGDFGLAWSDNDVDSLVGHAYGSIHGNVQYVVVPMPAPGWTPKPINGWRVAAVGPVPYLLRLER